MSIEKLIIGMKKGDVDCYNKLVDIINNYIDKLDDELKEETKEDLISDVFEYILDNSIETKSNIYKCINRFIKNHLHDNDTCDYDEYDNLDDIICETDFYNIIIHFDIMKDLGTHLTARENAVIRRRFFDNMTLDEIGQTFGVTGERIRCICTKSIRKLRNLIYKDDKINYLDYLDRIIDSKFIINPSIEYDEKLIEEYIKQEELNKLKKKNSKQNEPSVELKSKITDIKKKISIERMKRFHEERVRKEEERIRRIEEDRIRREEKERIRREKEEYKARREKEQYENASYTIMIFKYQDRLKEITNLIDKILRTTEGHRKELYDILNNYSKSSYDQYKVKLIEFYNKYRI